MTASYIQLLADGPGKKLRSRYLTIGADTVYEEYVQALRHARTVTTQYWFHSGALTVGAAADAANVGRVYIENDPDSTVLIALLKARFVSQHGTILVTGTSPRIALEKFTFTGNTPSGTAITGIRRDTTMTAKDSNWDVRTAATGMVITDGPVFASFMPPVALTAVGAAPPIIDYWQDEPDQPLIIRAGEGVMVKQLDAGTAADTRRFTFDFLIEQFTEQ